MTKGMMGVATYGKITEEEATAIENAGDPIDAPPGEKWTYHDDMKNENN